MKAIIGIIIVGAAALGALAFRGERAPMADTTESTAKAPVTEQSVKAPVKEFAINSFVEMIDGKPRPQFDPKELTVNEGDTVRLRVTVTKGTHDFHIDEFDIHRETPLDQEVVIEFKVDRAGEFVYYCNMPGHRAAGHWGTLKVLKAE